MTDYFFISSPLHFLIAANLSIQAPRNENTAVILCRDPEVGKRYRSAAKRFPGIFQRVMDAAAGASSRRGIKAAVFPVLQREFSRPMTARLFTGNDRRIEFQYAMHTATTLNEDVEGIYMDEGAATYVGHKSMHGIQHRWIDPLGKKLFYGFWYRNAVTTGTSSWISTAYVAFPDLAHPLLRRKTLVPIDPAPFTSREFRALTCALLEDHGDCRERLRGIRLVLTLPHEGGYIDNPEPYRALARSLFELFAPEDIAVKPHPRITEHDLPRQMFPGTTLLDHRIGMELLLPLLHDDCVVAGDISSTLLTTRWLRPDLPVLAVMGPRATSEALLRLYESLRIPIVRPGQLAEWLATRLQKYDDV